METHKTVCNVHDSGIKDSHDSSGSSVDTCPLSINSQEESSNDDSGNVSVSSDNSVSHDKDIRISTVQDHPAAQKTSERELQPYGEDAFPSRKRLDSDSPFPEGDALCSDNSISSSFCIGKARESINSRDTGEMAMTDISDCNSKKYKTKTVFTPGDDYIPIYSADYKNLFSHLMRDEIRVDSCRTDMYQCQTYLSENKRMHIPSPFSHPLIDIKDNHPIQTKNSSSHMSVSSLTSKAVDPRQHLFYQLVPEKKNNDLRISQIAPEMVPKVLFNKLTKELVKCKSENISLGKENRQLYEGYAQLLQQIEAFQRQTYNDYCQMNVEFPYDDKYSVPTGTASPSTSEDRSEHEYDDDVTKDDPVSIDVQLAKEIENRAGSECLKEDPPERSTNSEHIRHLQEELETERILRKQIEQKLKAERQRAERIESSLKDERQRFSRDIHKLTEKIRIYKARGSKMSSSETAKKSSTTKHGNNECSNSTESVPVDKSIYAKQGAIPKR